MCRTNFFLLLGVIALASLAQGADYYISPFGSDSNSGTSAHSPFLTLSKALDASTAGDTIHAANGYYTGTENVDLTINDRTLIGESTSGTVFQTDDYGFLVGDASTSIIDLTLKGTSSSGPIGISMGSSASLTISSVDFTTLGYGVQLGANSYNLTMTNCNFDNSVTRGISYDSSGSTVFWESIVITKSTFATASYPLYISCGLTNVLSQFTVADTTFTKTPISIMWESGADLAVFDRCTFANTTSTVSGGAVHIEADSAFVFNDCVFSNCASTSSGGAIFFMDDASTTKGFLNVTNSLFIGNQGSAGGAVNCYGPALTVSNSVFAFNNSTGPGGAIYVDDYYNSEANTMIEGSLFIGNSAASYGGAVDFSSWIPWTSVSDSVFAFNSASKGGAMALYSATQEYRFSSVSVIGNSASSSGGGLYLYPSTIFDGQALSLIGNSGQYGGGVYMDDGCTFTASAISIANNKAADGSGGGFFVSGGTLALRYASFSDNDANYGGGFYSYGSAAISVFGSKFSSNDATTSGGGYYCGDGAVNLGFVSFYHNESPEGSAYTCSGTCGTYASNVYVGRDNYVSGCSSDFETTTGEEVEALAAEHLARVPTITWEEASAMMADYM